MYINLLTFALSSSLWRSTENRTWWQVPLRQLHLLCSINLTFCDRKNIWLPWGSKPGQIWWWVPLRQLHLLCSIPQSWCERKKTFAYPGDRTQDRSDDKCLWAKSFDLSATLVSIVFQGHRLHHRLWRRQSHFPFAGLHLTAPGDKTRGQGCSRACLGPSSGATLPWPSGASWKC